MSKSVPTSKKLYAILNHLSVLTKLNIYSYTESNDPHFVAEFIPKPKTLLDFNLHSFKANHGEFYIEDHDMVVYTDETSLSYLVTRCQVIEDESLVIIGPFLLENPGSRSFTELGQHDNFSSEDDSSLLDYYSHLKILDLEYLYALSGLLSILLNRQVIDPKIHFLKCESPVPRDDTDQKKIQKQVDTINLHHSKLKDLLHFVAQGDQDNALKILTSMGMSSTDKTIFSSSSFKNLALDLNVRLQMVADGAQVSPYELCKEYNRVLCLIEDIPTAASLFQIQKDMVIVYCKLINESLSLGLSRPVKDAVHFIDQHVDKKISLLEISHHVGINESHLSRQFKKEMGKTVTTYINERKIITAKHYLENSNNSITTISTLCGFENHNYFSKVFKSYTGYTPHEYQKNIPPKERTF